MAQPAYIRNLKNYAKERFGGGDPADAVRALAAESDRGAIILLATSIEDTLEWALRHRMPALTEDLAVEDAIFGFDGCAGTFSKKTNLAYALGLIDKRARDEIGLIREMRNACAHGRNPMSFGEEAIVGICRKVIEEFLPFLSDQTPESLRHGFFLQCHLLQQLIISGKRPTAKELIQEARDALSIAS